MHWDNLIFDFKHVLSFFFFFFFSSFVRKCFRFHSHEVVIVVHLAFTETNTGLFLQFDNHFGLARRQGLVFIFHGIIGDLWKRPKNYVKSIQNLAFFFNWFHLPVQAPLIAQRKMTIMRKALMQRNTMMLVVEKLQFSQVWESCANFVNWSWKKEQEFSLIIKFALKLKIYWRRHGDWQGKSCYAHFT